MIKVTEKQQSAVEEFKRRGNDIHGIFQGISNDLDKTLCTMSSNQLAAAWLGVAEIEPEYVSFTEAIEAMRKGGVVRFHGLNSGMGNDLMLSTLSFDQYVLEDSVLGRHTLKDLYDGNWTIEGE